MIYDGLASFLHLTMMIRSTIATRGDTAALWLETEREARFKIKTTLKLPS